MDKIAADVTGIRRPSVLLHSCCGPCSSSVLERLTTDFDVTILWYNPNLYPESEYDKRLETQLELLAKSGRRAENAVKDVSGSDYLKQQE